MPPAFTTVCGSFNELVGERGDMHRSYLMNADIDKRAPKLVIC